MKGLFNKIRGKFAAMQLALLAMVFSGAAMATPVDPVATITAAIDTAKANATTIAAAVVVALWAIWGIYLMAKRR